MTIARFAIVGAAAACIVACSSSSDDKNSANANVGASAGTTAGGAAATTGAGGSAAAGTGNGGGTTNGGTSSGTGASTGTGATSSGTGATSSGTGGGSTAACPGLPFDGVDAGASCAGVTFEAERVDVDMYIMMDRSVSMAETVGSTGKDRWDLVHEAVQAFVQAPEAANIGVGIQFFGQSGNRDDTIDCDVSRYATPAVPIGLASQVGADVVAAIANTYPGGLTPTYPALQGAIQYAKTWAGGHHGRATVVVLVTDGYPTQCQNPVSVSDIAAVAQDGATSDPRIRTYVIGIAAGFNLDTIARAGGTAGAFLVDQADYTQSFLTTLLNISSNPLACEYAIPTSTDPTQQVDPNKVQVVYTPAVGAAEEVPRADSIVDCDASTTGGWYYDNTTAPTKIIACPCTCSRLAAGKVEVRLGCQPRHILH
jgi:hypothetical protein